MTTLQIVIITVSAFIGLSLVGIIVYLIWPQPYPSKTESDYTYHHSPWWQIYYSHKYLRPKRRAEKSSGLEAYFKGLDFRFSQPDDADDSERLIIGAVGDLMCRKDMLGEGHKYLWNDVGRSLFHSDLTIGNLEFPVNPDWYILKLLRFSVSGEYAEPLLGDGRHGKFDVLSLGNNHMNDSLHAGVVGTRDYLDKKAIANTGANRTKEEQDEVLIVEKKGVRIAVLSYSFSTNGVPFEKGKEFGVNVVRFNALNDEDYDPSLILRHIEIAKAKGADYIISCHHWGIDLEFYPPSRIVKRAHDLMDAGVDLIIGHHSHVIGQIDRYKTKDGRDTLIFYSLGNFTAAGLPFAVQRLGAMAHVTLRVTEKDGRNTVSPEQVTFTPMLFTVAERDGTASCEVLQVNREKVRSIKNLELTRSQQMELAKVTDIFEKNFRNKDNGIIYQ